MFLILALLLSGAPHELESIRLTQMQMFQLQLPYRYKVSLAEIGRDGLGRWELRVTDRYCNKAEVKVQQEPFAAYPPTRLRRNAIRGRLTLKLEDILWFPDDRFRHLDSAIIIADGEYLLVVMDRREKNVLWPLEAPEQPVP